MVLFCIFASLHLIWFLFVADQRHAPEAALSRWELLMELMSIMWMHHLSSHPPTDSFLFVLPCVFHSLIHQGNRIPEVCNNWAYCRGAEIDEKCLRNILTVFSLKDPPLFDLSASPCTWRRSAFKLYWCISHLDARAKSNIHLVQSNFSIVSPDLYGFHNPL